MTHVGCPCCQLRFTAAMAAYLLACPECGRPPQLIGAAEGVVGFRLFIPQDLPNPLPEAIAVSIPLPDPGADRS
jgi:hypothetical protein